MSSRARLFAAVTLLSNCLAGPAAWAQATNLEAGKTASQLFAGTCNACHKSPRGLLKTVSPGSLSGFLREHYTTGGEMASQLATYLISNGASDRSKQGADKSGQDGNDQADRQGRRNRNTPNQEAARPDDDTSRAGEGGRQGRRRQAAPADQPEDGRPVANVPAQGAIERSPDGHRLSAKQRSKPARPPGTDEPSMANEPPKSEPAKTESAGEDRVGGETRQDTGNTGVQPDAASKPGDEVKSEPAQPETKDAVKDAVLADKPAVRRDAVPGAMPAPAAGSGGPAEPAAARPPAPSVPEPAVTASAPAAPPPARGGGPPAPPISQ
jgi:hypothetical protein